MSSSLSRIQRSTTVLKYALWILVSLIGVILFTAVVPYNMDEFLFYNVILCYFYPGNNLHGACDPFALNIANSDLTLPLRTYHYVGSFPSLYYLPIHLVWNSPIAARMLGIGFISLGALVCKKIFNIKWKWILLGMIGCFPYLFQHLVDTGPIGFHILSVFIAYILIEKWILTIKKRYIVALTLMIFCGIWTKFAYFWYAPGFLIFLLIHLAREWKQLRVKQWLTLLSQGLVAICLLVALLAILLSSTHPHNSNDRPYLNQLIESESYSMQEIANGTWTRSNIINALRNPLEATHRVFRVERRETASMIYALLTYLFVPLSLIALGVKKRSAKPALRASALYISFLFTVVMIARTKSAGAMHHAILSYPFLILATLETIKVLTVNLKRVYPYLALYCVGFLSINIYFFSIFSLQQPHHHDTPEKFLAHTIINTGTISERFMILVSDWGMFYYSGLFGSGNQSVLFEWGIKDPNRINHLRTIAEKDGRKLLFLYTTAPTSTETDILKRTINLRQCKALSSNSKWQILAEPDSELEAICNKYNSDDLYDSIVKRIAFVF